MAAETKVLTAHVSLALADKVDTVAARLEHPRGRVREQALAAWTGQVSLQWIRQASSGFLRGSGYSGAVAPGAGARVVRRLAYAPDRLPGYPGRLRAERRG